MTNEDLDRIAKETAKQCVQRIMTENDFYFTVLNRLETVRVETLEDAAKVCESYLKDGTFTRWELAEAIRTLKEKK